MVQFEDQADIGSVSRPGSCEYDREQQTYTMSAAGANIEGDQNAFHFVWRHIKGDFIVTTQAAFIEAGGNPQRKMGWMARSSLEAGSPQMSSGIHGDGRPALQFRRKEGGPIENLRVVFAKPCESSELSQGYFNEKMRAANKRVEVVQMERKGSSYVMSAVRFGEPFEATRVDDIELGEDLYVGMFASSYEEGINEKATFWNVRIVKPVEEGFKRGRDPFGSRLEILDIGSGHRRIIYSAEQVFEAPNWTQDGKALIFNKDGGLYRFDLATGTPELIDTGEVVRNNNDHVLSFDGSRLAISSHGETDMLSRVYTVPVQGGRPKLITPKGPSYLHGWSPDGKFLVYTGQRDGQFDIYRIPAQGGKEERLTDTPGLDDGPEYSPDGRYIYFNSVRSGRMQLWRMRPDGSHPEQMTEDEYNNWFPHISPDGKWVVFISYLVGEAEPGDHPAARRVYLRTIPLDGGRPKVLAYLYGGQGTMNVPSWSPDSRQLAFVSNTVPEVVR